MSKILGFNKNILYKIPYLRINFFDNPYLLKNSRNFDLYTFKIPINIYIQNENNQIYLYSLSKDFERTEDTLRCAVKQYLPDIKTLLHKYTLNNENINLKDDSLCWFMENINIVKKNDLPGFIFPIQEKREQHMVTKSTYDIRTIIKMEDMDQTINGIWKRIKKI